MNRKSLTIAATTATAVSSAVLVAKKVKNNKKDEKINTYRNTELGKYDKNDKDIFKKLAECGDIKVAIATADRQLQKCEQNGEKPSQSNSATTVYKLVSEIVKKVSK